MDVPTQIYFPAISIYKQATVRVNFGPTFIIKPDISLNYLPISELQPLSVEDRKEHDLRILTIRKERDERLKAQEAERLASQSVMEADDRQMSVESL